MLSCHIILWGTLLDCFTMSWSNLALWSFACRRICMEFSMLFPLSLCVFCVIDLLRLARSFIWASTISPFASIQIYHPLVNGWIIFYPGCLKRIGIESMCSFPSYDGWVTLWSGSGWVIGNAKWSKSFSQSRCVLIMLTIWKFCYYCRFWRKFKGMHMQVWRIYEKLCASVSIPTLDVTWHSCERYFGRFWKNIDMRLW